MYAYLIAQMKSNSRHSYAALVTDIRNFGLFVDVPDLGMRGLVPLSRMEDDFYDFDSTRVQAIGRRSKNTIKLGDKLDVEIDKVDRFKKEVDFRPVSGGSSSIQRNRIPRGGRGRSKNEKKSGQRKKRNDRSKSSRKDSVGSRSGTYRGRANTGRTSKDEAKQGPKRQQLEDDQSGQHNVTASKKKSAKNQASPKRSRLNKNHSFRKSSGKRNGPGTSTKKQP